MVRDHALLSPFSLDCMVIPGSHLFSPVFTSVSHHSSFATVLRYGFSGRLLQYLQRIVYWRALASFTTSARASL